MSSWLLRLSQYLRIRCTKLAFCKSWFLGKSVLTVYGVSPIVKALKSLVHCSKILWYDANMKSLLIRVGILAICVELALAQNSGGRTQNPNASAQSPRALLDQYCVTCHNEKLKTAN